MIMPTRDDLQHALDTFLLELYKERKEKFLKAWKESIESNTGIHVTLVGDNWCPDCNRFWVDTSPIDANVVERWEYIQESDATFPDKKRHVQCPSCHG